MICPYWKIPKAARKKAAFDIALLKSDRKVRRMTPYLQYYIGLVAARDFFTIMEKVL